MITKNSDFLSFIGFDKFDITNLFLTWIDKDFGIIPAYAAPIYFIYYFLIHIFGHMAGSIMIWWLFYCIGSIFLIFSFREFLKIQNKTSNRPSEFLIGFFYVFFIPLQYLPNSPFTFTLPYLALPLVFFLILKFSNSKNRNTLKYSVIITITMFFLTGMQIVFSIFLLIAILFLILYLLAENKIKLIEILKLFFLSTILYLILSAPYYYQTIYLKLKTQSDLVNEALTIEKLSFTQSNSFLTEVYKILGGTSFYYFYKGRYSIPSAVSYFKDPLYIFLSYIGILFFSLFLLDKNNKNLKITFLVMFLISIFFMSGIHNPPPLNIFYNYMYNNFPFFSIFRNGTKISFILLFIYSISLGMVSNNIFGKLNKNKKTITFLLIFIPIFLIAKPLYQSDFYSHANVKIPKDFQESIDYINKNIKSRALIVPITPFPVYTFADSGVDPYGLSSNMRVLTNVSSGGFATKALSQIKKLIDEKNLDATKDIFKKLNINYIIWNKYVDTKRYDLPSPYEHLDFYKENFKVIKNFNNNILIFEI
jgi:hypothetical protein